MTTRATSRTLAPSSTMTATASLYLRKSKASGADSTGLQAQEADLRALAERHGLEVVSIWTDDGESGALRNRPGLLAWLADAREGRATHLLAWRLDRVSRGGTAGLARFLDTVKGIDADGTAVSEPVRFLSYSDNLDSGDVSAWPLMVGVLGGMAEAEREATKARNIASHERLRAEGRWNGGVIAYGLRAVPNPDGAGKVLEVDEAEAATLRLAAARVVAGEPVVRVVRYLNDHGHAPRRAAAWSRTSLRNTLVKGDGAAEVLDASTLREVRRILSAPERRTSTSNRRPARLLSGVLVCHSCGSRLAVSSKHDAPSFYRCPSDGAGQRCARPVAASAEAVEAAVSAAWLAGWGSLPETVSVRLSDEASERLAQAEDRVDAARAALAVAPRSERAEALAALDAAEDEAERLAALPALAMTVLRETGRTYGDVWEAGTLEDRRDALARTVGALALGPGVRGRRTFDLGRILDAWRLDPAAVEHEAAA